MFNRYRVVTDDLHYFPRTQQGLADANAFAAANNAVVQDAVVVEKARLVVTQGSTQLMSQDVSTAWLGANPSIEAYEEDVTPE